MVNSEAHGFYFSTNWSNQSLNRFYCQQSQIMTNNNVQQQRQCKQNTPKINRNPKSNFTRNVFRLRPWLMLLPQKHAIATEEARTD